MLPEVQAPRIEGLKWLDSNTEGGIPVLVGALGGLSGVNRVRSFLTSGSGTLGRRVEASGWQRLTPWTEQMPALVVSAWRPGGHEEQLRTKHLPSPEPREALGRAANVGPPQCFLYRLASCSELACRPQREGPAVPGKGRTTREPRGDLPCPNWGTPQSPLLPAQRPIGLCHTTPKVSPSFLSQELQEPGGHADV